MINVLDIDIDLFVDPRARTSSTRQGGRVTGVEAWPYERVRHYLEFAVGVTTHEKLSGGAFETHDQILDALSDIGSPIRLFHLDAHADLGIGLNCYDFYASFVAIEPVNRPARLHEFLPKEGDFLLYAIACGFVARLDYVTHADVYMRAPDIPIGMDKWEQMYTAGHLHIKRFTGTEEQFGERERPETPDRSIPIRMYDRDELQLRDIAFDYMFITRSPWYTPVGSDRTYRMLQEDFLGIVPNGC